MITLNKTLEQADSEVKPSNAVLRAENRLKELNKERMSEEKEGIKQRESFEKYALKVNNISKLYVRYENWYTYSCNHTYTCDSLLEKIDSCVEKVDTLDEADAKMLKDLLRYYDALVENREKPCFIVDRGIKSPRQVYNKYTDFHVVIVDLSKVEEEAETGLYSKYGITTFVNRLCDFKSHINGKLAEYKTYKSYKNNMLNIVLYKNKICHIEGVGFYKIENNMIKDNNRLSLNLVTNILLAMLGF